MKKLKSFASFIKIEHTLFSLPVVFAGAFLAESGIPDPLIIILIILAAAGARTAALGINRIIDRDIDLKNPRTKGRELPSGKMTLRESYAVVLCGLVLYFVSAYMICDLVFLLSPVPLAVFIIYPYMKRFTPFCHYGVGLALSLAPVAGWLAVKCSFDGLFPAIILGAFTFFWVAGFDMIYATLDEQYDREEGIYSMVSEYGKDAALKVSAISHITAFICLLALFIALFPSLIPGLVLIATAVLLYLEHKRSHDVDLAFFRINIMVGFVVFIFILSGIYFH